MRPVCARQGGVRFARFCKAADYTYGLEGTALKKTP